MSLQVTCISPCSGLGLGVKIKFYGDTNRVRRAITEIVSDTAINVSMHLRPSRGFAKHIRRDKQSKGKK